MKIKLSYKVFKALGNEIRFKIVKMLLEENKCLSDISKRFDRDFSVLYKHIRILEDAGIVEMRKVGKSTEICIKDPETVKKLLDIAIKIERKNK